MTGIRSICCVLFCLFLNVGTSGWGEELADVIERCERSVVRIEVESDEGKGLGSGFLAERPGWVVTNLHVMAGAKSAVAYFADGRKCTIDMIVHFDRSRDVAIVRITGEGLDGLPRLPFTNEVVRKGETVVAMGSPVGLSFTATTGIVSAIRSAAELQDETLAGTWIQIDAPLSPGNSGGPLINNRGEVVAMSTLASKGELQNLNFGISSGDIRFAVTKAAEANSGFRLDSPPPDWKKAPPPKEDQDNVTAFNLKPVPIAAINAYLEETLASRAALTKELRSVTAQVHSQLEDFKKGATQFPDDFPAGDEVVIQLKQGKNERWFFRDAATKNAVVKLIELRHRQYSRVLKQMSTTDSKQAVSALVEGYGAPVQLQSVGSVGFLSGARCIHAFNGHDVLVSVRGLPAFLYMESTAGLYADQEILPIPVYVVGTKVIPMARVTGAVTLLQQVPSQDLAKALDTFQGPSTGKASSSASTAPAPKSGPTRAETMADAMFGNVDQAGLAAKERVWTDRSGKFKVTATLAGVKEGKVALRKQDGSTIQVPITGLSDEDQAFLRKVGSR